MLRRTTLLAAAVLALACSKNEGTKKSGPVVAQGKNVTVTADEFKARLEEQSPFLRARYSTLERKKEFLDNLIRFEVLAQAAEKEGLGNDPDVQQTLKKVMVQKLVQKKFGDQTGAKDVPEAELQAYYDAHKDEYFRPARKRVSVIAFVAPEGSADRAKKVAAAKKALQTVKAQEKNPTAFAQAVSTLSEDATSKASAGDLGYKTQADLEKAYSKSFADAVFALQDGQLSGVLETPAGAYVAKVTGHQDEVNRDFEQVKAQIANKLHREKRTKEFDAWIKSLRDEANVQVDEKALEAVEIAAAPPGGAPGGMGGHGGGMGGMMGGPKVAPAPAPAAPAPAPAQ